MNPRVKLINNDIDSLAKIKKIKRWFGIILFTNTFIFYNSKIHSTFKR